MITAKLNLIRSFGSAVALAMILSILATSDASGQGLTVRSSNANRSASQSQSRPVAGPQSDQTKSPAQPVTLQGVTYSNPVRNKWKVGVKARVGSGTVKNATFTFPIPKNWPEQTVSVVEDEIPSNAIIEDERSKDPGLQQMVIRFPTLSPGQEVMITRTFLVTTSQVDPPTSTDQFIKPNSRVNDSRKYLRVSPGINYQNSKIKKQVKAITKDKENVWEQVETIYDWVRDNIEDSSDPPKQLQQVFLQKSGCNEDKVSLFVGMCRAHKIPARTVWVQGTIYAEFMLADEAGNGFWFPCNIGGIREFGSYAEPRIVLLKGDNFRVPEKEQTQKFVGEVFQGQIQKGKTRPRYAFFRQLLPAD